MCFSLFHRYGFDAELFSFESGRRCPTGPGIYAFKCRRAEALFNLLQLQIQNITEEVPPAAPPTTTHDTTAPDEVRVGDARVGVGVGGVVAVPPTDVEGYLEPMPRPPPPTTATQRHPSLVPSVSAPGNSVQPRVQVMNNNVPTRVAPTSTTTQGMEALNIHPMGPCFIPRYNGSSGVGGSYGGYGGGGGSGYRGVGYASSDRGGSVSYRGGHNANSFLFNSLGTDASDSGDGSSVAGGVRPASGGMARSPASPPAPLSPLTVTLYKGGSDDTPPTPGRDPPPTPTDPVHGVRVNHVTNVVSYDAHPPTSNRPVSFPTCPPATSIITQLNPSRRPQAFSTTAAAAAVTHYDPKVSSFDDGCEDKVYVNVPSDRSHDHSHVYVNLQDKLEGPIVPPRPSLTLPPSSAMVDEGVCCGSGSSNSGTNTTTDTDHHNNSQLNYVIVELEVNSDSSAVPPQSPPGSITSGLESPNRSTTTEGYTQIDFIKTAAISSCAANANPTLEVGCSRKTRHNSTFAAANPVVLTRHNSSLSD